MKTQPHVQEQHQGVGSWPIIRKLAELVWKRNADYTSAPWRNLGVFSCFGGSDLQMQPKLLHLVVYLYLSSFLNFMLSGFSGLSCLLSAPHAFLRLSSKGRGIFSHSDISAKPKKFFDNLKQGSANTFCKEPDSKYLGFAGHPVSVATTHPSLSKCKSSQRQ